MTGAPVPCAGSVFIHPYPCEEHMALLFPTLTQDWDSHRDMKGRVIVTLHDQILYSGCLWQPPLWSLEERSLPAGTREARCSLLKPSPSTRPYQALTTQLPSPPDTTPATLSLLGLG